MTPERFERLKSALDRRQPDLVVVSESAHKPHNLAALMRTCDAVGVPRVHAVATREEIRLPLNAASGSLPWVRLALHADIAGACAALKSKGFRIVAAHLSEGAADYRSVDYTGPTALLLGSELYGVSDQAAALADQAVVIPMRALVASLNVSVAAALILFEAARQREAAGLYGQRRLSPEEYTATLFEWCYPEIAAGCRERGLPYPALDGHGLLAEHPYNRPQEPAGGSQGSP